MNILIIEDDMLQQRVMTGFIERIRINGEEINTFVTNNGREALDFLKSTAYGMDIIFSDLKMPVMDGLEFSKKFRETDESTPIVIMTCNYEQWATINDDAVTMSLKKPINPDHLKVIIREFYKSEPDDIGHSNNKMTYK